MGDSDCTEEGLCSRQGGASPDEGAPRLGELTHRTRLSMTGPDLGWGIVKWFRPYVYVVVAAVVVLKLPLPLNVHLLNVLADVADALPAVPPFPLYVTV